MSRLRFGWLTPAIGNRGSGHRPIAAYQDTAILPAALPHFDSLWVADHFYGMDTPTDPFLEAWTTLTWLAARHPDVELCHHVLGVGYRPPPLLAKMAATLHHLSGHRLVLGIGAGWRAEEYAAYGYAFPRPPERFEQLEEAITICRLMWTEAAPTFTGRHFRIEGAAAPPLTDPPPRVCVGAAGERRGLPLVGRLADAWNGPAADVTDPRDWHRRRGVVRAAAEAAGRDPDAIEVSVTLERALPASDADSERLVTELAAHVDLGVDHVVMDFGHPTDTEPVLRFAEQVIAPLRDAAAPDPTGSAARGPA